MLLLTTGLQFVAVSNEWRATFDEGDPQLAAYDALEETYTPTNVALIAIAPKEGSVFTREALGAVEALTEAARHVPWSVRVDSLTNFQHTEVSGDDLRVESLVSGAEALDDDGLARVRKIALGEIDLTDRLVSGDGRVAGLTITFALPEESDAAESEIAEHVDGLLDKARMENPGIAFYLSGNVFFNRVGSKAAEDDLRFLVPVSFLVIVGVAAILLRSLLGTLSLVVTLVFVIGSTMGAIGWTGTVLNAANSGVPIILMTITVAHSVHIVGSVLSGMGRGLDRRAAIVESLRGNAWLVFLTTATTMIGFLSLNASESPPFRVLGNLVAFGVLFAFVYSMTLLPAMLSVLPLRGRPQREDRCSVFDRLATFVIARRGFLLWSVAAVSVALAAGVPRVELTDDWLQYLEESHEFRRDTDFIIDNLTGLQNLEYSLSAGREGGITDPGYLRKIDAFAEWYRAQPEVAHVRAFSDIMKQLNKNMHGGDAAYDRLPEDPDLAAQYLLLYELSVPVGHDLNNRIDIAKSATRMTVSLRRLNSEQHRALDLRGQNWLRTNAPELASAGSGRALVFAHMARRNMTGMLWGTAIAMCAVSLILIGTFRSLRLGLVSLIPNFIPAAMAFGLWGYLVGEVGYAGTLVTAIAFGTVVDDTVHFMGRYLKARREDLPPIEAVRYAFRTVGFALFTTTAVLVLGFLVFTTSGFTVSSMLGFLVALTIGFALFCDFLLLPPLLIAIDRGKRRCGWTAAKSRDT